MTNIAPDLAPLTKPIDTFEHLPGNPRRGAVEAIAKSLTRFGQRKPIVANRDGTVIAGNHTLRAARELGWTHIAAVTVEDDQSTAAAFALADNRTSDLGTYDDEALALLLQQVADDDSLLDSTGYDHNDHEQLLNGLDSPTPPDTDTDHPYTNAINLPQYEIVGDEPEITELADTTRRDELLEWVNASDLDPEVVAFLTLAAHRHVVFDYRKVAEWYAHQTPDVQRLAEQSALVIIDHDDAIARGFARFTAINDLARETDIAAAAAEADTP